MFAYSITGSTNSKWGYCLRYIIHYMHYLTDANVHLFVPPPSVGTVDFSTDYPLSSVQDLPLLATNNSELLVLTKGKEAQHVSESGAQWLFYFPYGILKTENIRNVLTVNNEAGFHFIFFQNLRRINESLNVKWSQYLGYIVISWVLIAIY